MKFPIKLQITRLGKTILIITYIITQQIYKENFKDTENMNDENVWVLQNNFQL